MSSSQGVIGALAPTGSSVDALAGAGPAAVAWRVSILELSLATSPLADLERAEAELRTEDVARLFDRHPEIEEIALLRTCHRLELLILDRESQPLGVRSDLPGPADGWRLWSGAAAAQHLHRVTAGLESLATAEREVREQVQRAVGSVRSRHPRPVLAELLRGAVRAARELDNPRSTRRSIAAIAAARLLSETPRPFPRVVVVGSGAVGRQVTEALAPYARVTIVYRSSPPADEVLRATGSRAAPLCDLLAELRVADAIVAAAKTGERILSRSDLDGRDGGLVAIDLGLPRNIDPEVRTLPRVRLLDLEELHSHGADRGTVPAFEEAVAASAREDWRRIVPWLEQPVVDARMREAERLRRREVEKATPHLGPLSPVQREAVEHLTRRLTERLVRPRSETPVPTP